MGTQDFFDIDGSWISFREAKKLYSLLGHGERVDLFESNEPHGFTRPRRRGLHAAWMRRWLLGKDDAPTEAEFSVAADRDVQCTGTGQVLTEFHGKSAFDLNAERATELAKHRPAPAPDAIREAVRKRLALPGRQPILVKNHKHFDRGGYTLDTWTLETEPGAVVVERLFRPVNPAPGHLTVIYVGADPALGAPGGPIEGRVAAGDFVAMIEPRGTGRNHPLRSETPRLQRGR